MDILLSGEFEAAELHVWRHCLSAALPHARWLDREDRLRRIILNPSLILVWLFGLMLAVHGGFWMQGWFHAKLALVLALSGYHGWVIGYFRKLRRGLRPLSGRALRLLNEVPGVIAIAVVILVFVKPF